MGRGRGQLCRGALPVGPDQGGARAIGHYNGTVGRRRLWIIAGTALALGAVLTLAIYRSPAHLAFLGGHRPIEQRKHKYTGFDSTGHRVGWAGTMDVYQWREDPRAVAKRAREELLPMGYEEATGSYEPR